MKERDGYTFVVVASLGTEVLSLVTLQEVST